MILQLKVFIFFTEFNKDKILKVNGRHITILNEKLLKQISEKG